MKILLVERHGSWGLISQAGFITRGKFKPDAKLSAEGLDKWLTSGHSPIRRVSISVVVSAPAEPISHLVRHIHSIHFVESRRPDITGKPRDNRERLYLIQANLQEWIQIAHDRLCSKAASSTQDLVTMIRNSFVNHDEYTRVLAKHMVPSCLYLGRCKEVFEGCGWHPVKRLNDKGEWA